MCISGDAVEVQLAFDAGADDFLHKPFKEQKVQKFIKQFIKMA
jgi:FixJ family two-component response regulator